MAESPSTVDVRYFSSSDAPVAQPGIVVVFRAGQPTFNAHAMREGEVEVGRAAPRGLTIDDRAMSRLHARIRWDGKRFEIQDLGSRNGVVVDGVEFRPNECAFGSRVLRLGETVIVLCSDVSPALGDTVTEDNGIVICPRLRRAWKSIDEVASTSEVLHLRGASGSGKEAAAERFHHAAKSKRSGALVPVNCAAIPKGVAERLLFGAKKGAFSGAHADVDGYIKAADGGTLFLDEIGELDLEVQAKLLRVIESRTVTPVGDVKSHKVDFRLVSATHKELRAKVGEQAFREDLFYRVGRPEVALPSLWERPEAIPYLVKSAVGDHPIDASYIEQVLLREWPGNVRELLLEAKESARIASGEGSRALTARHLSDSAGLAHQAQSESSASNRIDKSMLPSREVIEESLRKNDGKVATTARALGIHRNQLRRWLKEHEVDPNAFRSDQ